MRRSPTSIYCLFLLANEEPIISFDVKYAQKFMPDLSAPVGNVILGIGVARPDFLNFTKLYGTIAFPWLPVTVLDMALPAHQQFFLLEWNSILLWSRVIRLLYLKFLKGI